MFSDEELEAAILRYLTSDAVAPRTEAGMRDVVAAKEQVYEIISASFMLRPSAFFALCWLATNALAKQVNEQLVDLKAIIEAAPRASGTSPPVTSTTDLLNAEASLVTLTAAFEARASGVAGAVGPTIARFNASIDRFVREQLTAHVVSGGEVVKTPEALRAEIAGRWATVRARHAAIVERVARIANAVDDYRATRLPDRVVSSLLVRIQAGLSAIVSAMQGEAAAAKSRDTLLELTAMRVLLRQVTTFRAPVLQKAPLTGDATNGALQPSATSSSIVGTVSGPYDYAPQTVLTARLGDETLELLFPAHSAAELRSRMMVPYIVPTTGWTVAVRTTSGVSAAVVTTWSDPATAARQLQAGLDGITVSWEAASSTLVLRSTDVSDAALIEVLYDNTIQQSGADWLLGVGAPRRAQGTPVAASTVATALAAEARLKTEVTRRVWASARGTPKGTSFDATVAAGTLSATGSTTVVADLDVGVLGAQAGMAVVLEDGATYALQSVAGAMLVLDRSVAAGSHGFRIGPDFRAVPVGARVRIGSGSAVGTYRVQEGHVAELELDRIAVGSDEALAVISEEHLVVSLRDASAGITLEILDGPGAAALGLVGTVKAAASRFDSRVDLAARGVVVGDRLLILSDTSTEHEITAIAGTVATFEPPRAYEASPCLYRVRDTGMQNYLVLAAQLEAFASDPGVLLSRLESEVSRLIRGARYAGSIQTTLAAYVGALVVLEGALSAYVVPRDAMVEGAVRLMSEYGFDRALEIFLAPQLSVFFGLDADGVSYKTWLMRSAIEATRVATPVTKDSGDYLSSSRTVSVQPSTYDPNTRS